MTEIEKIAILTADDCSYRIKGRWGKSRKGSRMRCMKRLDIGVGPSIFNPIRSSLIIHIANL